MKRKPKQSDFEYLTDLKAAMKSFLKKEEEIRRAMDIETNNKKFKLLQKELDTHLASFPELEKALVEEESKMINLERGLYKGIAINVKDKTFTKIPLYWKFSNIKNHVGYTGTTQVGKSKNMISDARQLTKLGWDVVIVDPKGGEGQEILTETMEAALTSNRAEDFKYLSPAFPKESELANLLYGMADDEGASLMRTFAESVSDDSFFTGIVFESSLSALKSLTFIQAATDPTGEYTRKLEEQEMQRYIKLKNFKNASEEVSYSKWNDTNNPNELLISTQKNVNHFNDVEKLKKPSHTLYQNRSMVTFKILGNYSTYESLESLRTTVSTISIPPADKIGRQRYNEIANLREEALSILEKTLSTDKTNFAKISKTYSVLLSQLIYGDIGQVFSGVGINPIANRLLSEDRGLICVMQPYPMKYKTISNMTVMAMLKSIESMMGLVGTSGRKNKRQLAIMIDEAAAVLYKDSKELYNKASALGATIFAYTQSYEDYADAVGPIGGNIIQDNTNTDVKMRMNHPESQQRASDSLGTIRKHQSMYMAMGHGASGRFSVGNEDEPIALPEDIGNLPVATGYVKHNGETYIVDFQYVKGMDNYPIKMPTLEGEKARRYIAKYEEQLLNNVRNIQNELSQIEINE